MSQMHQHQKAISGSTSIKSLQKSYKYHYLQKFLNQEKLLELIKRRTVLKYESTDIYLVLSACSDSLAGTFVLDLNLNKKGHGAKNFSVDRVSEMIDQKISTKTI